MTPASDLYRAAKRVYSTEGATALTREGLRFVTRRLYRRESYYCYTYALSEAADDSTDEITPTIEGLTSMMVRSNEQADELELQGLEFRSRSPRSRRALDAGAVAHCMFVGRELASVGWIVTTEEAKAALGDPPHKVDFAHGEACTTAVWTNPAFRRMGLGHYGAVVRDCFLLDSGYRVRRSVIGKDNTPSATGAAKLRPEACTEARYVRMLWWKTWRERPLL